MKHTSGALAYLLKTVLLSQVLGLIGCDAHRGNLRNSQGSETEVVSLISVIANPERYEGRSLLLRGFLHIDYEGTALYLHHTDYQCGLTENAVAVTPRREMYAASDSYADRYVILCGVFRLHEKWGTGRYAGILEEISSISADRNADGSHVTNSDHLSWPTRAAERPGSVNGSP